VVRPADPAAFVYVMRDDSRYVARELAARLGAQDPNSAETETAIVAEYETFLAGLYRAFAAAAAPRGPLELHIYQAEDIEAARLALIPPGNKIVSLDPLCRAPGAVHLGLSRWYAPGGWDLAGEGSRPGFPAMAEQISRLAFVIGKSPVALVEDDVYTGETLIATAGQLRAAGIDVRQLVVGIRICQNELAFDGAEIGAAVQYELDPARPVGDQIDLGDPRDFLIGLSGLVIVMGEAGPLGHDDRGWPRLGRAPYVLPFVQPSERASLPAESDWELSRTVLALAAGFYARLSDRLGEPVLLRHCDPEFAAFARHYLGTDPGEPMTGLIGRVLEDAQSIAAMFFPPGRLQTNKWSGAPGQARAPGAPGPS
jgi:hypothetical protein